MASYDAALSKIFEERITNLYKKYDASKLSSVPSLLVKYKGNEEKLIRAMVTKYGPEPAPEEMDDGDDEDEAEAEGAAEEKATVAEKKQREAIDEDDYQDEDDEEEEGPREVVYCGVCGMPPEYCEYGADYEKCVPWLTAHCPHLLKKNDAASEQGEGVGAKKKKRGGGVVKKKELAEDKMRVLIYTEVRSRKKTVTVVDGLETLGVKLKDASKLFGRKFASSSSVKDKDTGGSEIVIQGDVIFDLPDLLHAEFGIPSAKLFTKDAAKKIVPLR